MPDRNFDIDLDYKPPTGFASAFEEAAERWEDVIVADLPNVQEVDDLLIKVRVILIDGEGGTLGQAGPTRFRKEGGLPYIGVMEFDVADVASITAGGTLPSEAMHEMARLSDTRARRQGRHVSAHTLLKSPYVLSNYALLVGSSGGKRGDLSSHFCNLRDPE